VADKARATELGSIDTSRWSLLQALEQQAPDVFATGAVELHGDMGTVVAWMRSSYRVSPPLSDALNRVASYGTGWATDLYRFGRGKSGLRMIESSQGTAHCQVFVFFDVAPDGSARLVDAPPGTRPGQLCAGTSGNAGEVAGVPTFVVEDQKLPANNIVVSLTPWQQDGWQRTCRIDFRFSAVYRVDERACQGVDCDRIESEVLRQVDRVDRKAPEETNNPRVDRAAFDRMKALAPDHASKFLPGFPRDKPSLFSSSFLEFGDATFVPIVVDGETYLGQIGHGAFWRTTTPDYLFAAYRLADGRLEPVAAFYIGKARGALLGVTTEP
jgi:hypothetical protein